MALREKISILAGFCHELKKGLLSHADDLCIYNWLFVLIIIPTERQVHSNVLCHEPMKGLLSHAAGETD